MTYLSDFYALTLPSFNSAGEKHVAYSSVCVVSMLSPHCRVLLSKGLCTQLIMQVIGEGAFLSLVACAGKESTHATLLL